VPIAGNGDDRVKAVDMNARQLLVLYVIVALKLITIVGQ